MPRTTDEQLVLEEFGQRVKTARDGHKWTQEVLGERAGMHRTYVGAIERGEKNLSLLKLNQLALALGTGFDGFLPYRATTGESAGTNDTTRGAGKTT